MTAAEVDISCRPDSNGSSPDPSVPRGHAMSATRGSAAGAMLSSGSGQASESWKSSGWSASTGVQSMRRA